MTSTTQHPYRLSISLNVLEHLGLNLYSNVPAVLAEAVANAWDADASRVDITWSDDNNEIIIQDDGTGMTEDQVNDRFLTIGYQRRVHQPGPTPQRKRQPMGRKGIGKLSLFSIADTIVVETTHGNSQSALEISATDIRKHIDQQRAAASESQEEQPYYPKPLPKDNIDFTQGTRITLRNLRKKQTVRSPEFLRRRIARRFTIIGAQHGFIIFVNRDQVTPSDRAYIDHIQYVWTYDDDSSESIPSFPNALHREPNKSLTDADKNIRISGWLGTVQQPSQLASTDGDNLNRIAIFMRDKLAQEDILADFVEGGVYARYLVGELRIEGLDTYDGSEATRDEDISTSSRQRLVEGDPRYAIIQRLIQQELKSIQSQWANLRREAGAAEAGTIPIIREWLSSLSAPEGQLARKWLGRLNSMRFDDEQGQSKTEMLKHAILAFEAYRINERLAMLEDAPDETLEFALAIAGQLDEIESSYYAQTVRSRLTVIRALRKHVDENSLEKAIQQYLFDHLWLLDPAWERVQGTEVMERSVNNIFDRVNKTLSDDERKGRLDIQYRKSAGQHVIVELKRPKVKIRVPEVISRQISRYDSEMRAELRQQGLAEDQVEIVLVVGAEPDEWQNTDRKKKDEEALRVYNARLVFYKQLLANAEAAYHDYFKHDKAQDRLRKILAAIEDFGAT